MLISDSSIPVTTTPDGQMKIVKNVVVPTQTVVSGKNTLTSLLTSNNTKLAGRRILMTKGPDGTTRVITGTANILPKNLQTSQQSLIKTTTANQPIQTAVQQQVQIHQTSRFQIYCLIYIEIEYQSIFLIFIDFIHENNFMQHHHLPQLHKLQHHHKQYSKLSPKKLHHLNEYKLCVLRTGE